MLKSIQFPIKYAQIKSNQIKSNLKIRSKKSTHIKSNQGDPGRPQCRIQGKFNPPIQFDTLNVRPLMPSVVFPIARSTHSSPRTPLLRCLCRMPLLLTRACGVRPHRCTVNMRSPFLLRAACSTSSSSTSNSVIPSRIRPRSRTSFRTHPPFWPSRPSGPTLHCSVHLLLTTFGVGSCANQELMLRCVYVSGQGQASSTLNTTTCHYPATDPDDRSYCGANALSAGCLPTA